MKLYSISFILALLLHVNTIHSTTIRCDDRGISVLDDYFNYWTVKENYAYLDDDVCGKEIAINNRNGECRYYGQGLVLVWKRNGILIPNKMRKVDYRTISINQVLILHETIDYLKREELSDLDESKLSVLMESLMFD